MEDATVDSEVTDEAIWIPDLQTPASGMEVPEQEVQKTSVQIELEPYKKPKRLRKQPERYGFSSISVSSTVPAEEILLSEAFEGPEKEQWRRDMTDSNMIFCSKHNHGLTKIQAHDSLKKKWKNLKDSYRKELKKVPTFRSGDEDLAEELSPSLLESPPPPPSVSILPSNPTSSPQQPPTPQSRATTSRENEKQNSSRKRLKTTELRAEYLEIERKKLKLLEADLAGGKEKDIPKSDDYTHTIDTITKNGEA
ncbi:unnamed protein product [Arctia plantaginis]|uniref:MADF domain-containing protein n=1 Tax=Arctia plantaginis TaxID=874455 RepID=A0A8S0ZM37_ARCPL|nr:unnamed protein product [Arctia plantaginis]CAB3262152.1 unnamed protein product [Arctia plantaginis]